MLKPIRYIVDHASHGTYVYAYRRLDKFRSGNCLRCRRWFVAWQYASDRVSDASYKQREMVSARIREYLSVESDARMQLQQHRHGRWKDESESHHRHRRVACKMANVAVPTRVLHGCRLWLCSMIGGCQTNYMERCQIRLNSPKPSIWLVRRDGWFKSLSWMAKMAKRARLWSVDGSACAMWPNNWCGQCRWLVAGQYVDRPLPRRCGPTTLAALHSGRTSVCDRRTFSVPRSTGSWRVTTDVGKPSAIGQPTRPTQRFIISGSINWLVSNFISDVCWSRHLLSVHGVKPVRLVRQKFSQA